MKAKEAVLIARGQEVRALCKEVTVDGVRRVLPDGQELFFYELKVDTARLRNMARAAASNTKGKAVRGAFTLRVTERKRIEA